jgi:ligand-binding sensor domain-containing protein
MGQGISGRLRRSALLLLGFLVAFASMGAAQNSPLYTKWVNYTAANGFPDGQVFCVTVDGPRVWAGTRHGLVLIENGRVKRIFTPKDGLAGLAVMSVAVDKQTGDVWIGTFGGLSRYSGGVFKNYTNLTSGLANDLVYGVAVQGKYLWVATAAGVNRLNMYTGEWSIFNETNAPFNEPWGYGISVGKQNIYFAVWGGGVLMYNLAGHYWKPYTDPDGEMDMVLYRNQGLIHNIVSGVSWDESTHSFWASTYFGLSSYDGRNWHNYLKKDSGLISNFINSVNAQGNEVWACTQRGLSELNTATNTWTTYRPNPKSGKGEILLTSASGKKRTMTTATSIANNYIYAVTFQGTDIWVGTGAGLSHGILQTGGTR